MDKYRFTVSAGGSEHPRPYSNEELKFLTGDGSPEISAFRKHVGLWDNFSVSRGMDANAWTIKKRLALLAATIALRQRLEAEEELFSYNYKLRCPCSLSRGSSKCGLALETGEVGVLLARHSGQLYFQIDSPEPDIRDMRTETVIETVHGRTHIYRKRNELRWHGFLSDLGTFLANSDADEVSIRHDHARPEA